MPVFALADDDPLQALAFFFRTDLPRDARVIDRRHVNQEASRQRDVAGNARAFFADWLFRDLHQNFLAFFQQVADERQMLRFTARETSSSATSAATIALSATATVEVGAARALSVGRSRGGGPPLRSRLPP